MMKRADPETHGAGIRWRKDGGPAINGSLIYKFPNSISPSDRGIYEIYYVGERNMSRGSLYQLIVRGKC